MVKRRRGGRRKGVVGLALALAVLLGASSLSGCSFGGSRGSGGPEANPAGRPGNTSNGEARASGAELPGALIAMIDNHPNARPQSGLDKADLVYEIDCEAGITRFMAIFYSQAAPKVGPIRSARFYYAQLAKPYQAPYAHAGGNMDVLAMLKSSAYRNFPDLDEIYNASRYFWRERGRKAPHNLYTSTDKMLEGARDKGYTLHPLDPLPTGTVEGGTACPSFTLEYANKPSYTYRTQYVYGEGKYAKLVNGRPFRVDNGTQIRADNVIVMVAKSRWIKREQWETDIDVIGQGQAYYFVGGKVYQGTWYKPSVDEPLQFWYGNQRMAFAPGKTWINVIPEASKLQMDL